MTARHQPDGTSRWEIDMLADIGPTLQTTYSLQLLVDGQWSWYSSAEYTSAEAVRDQLRLIYGGATKARIEEQFAPTRAAVHTSAIELFGRLIRP